MEHSQKIKERIQKFKETGDSRYIYQNELDKASFQYDMDYGGLKDLTGRIISDKILRDKAFKIAKNLKYDGYQRGLALMIYKLFDKKTSAIKKIIKNYTDQLLENLKSEEYIHLLSIIFGVPAFGDIQLICKFNKRFIFLFCLIDVFSRYPCVIPLKDKKGITTTNAFQNVLDDFNHKTNKTCHCLVGPLRPIRGGTESYPP